jgi:DNA-binding transcriptional LysR family regulator
VAIAFRSRQNWRSGDCDCFIDGAWQTLPVRGRMIVSDAPSLLAACISGHGIAQPLLLYSREALQTGKLVRLLPQWNQERYPLYAYLPSRRHPSAKVRRFLTFVEELIANLTAR